MTTTAAADVHLVAVYVIGIKWGSELTENSFVTGILKQVTTSSTIIY